MDHKHKEEEEEEEKEHFALDIPLIIVGNKCDAFYSFNDLIMSEYVIYLLRSLAAKYNASLFLASSKLDVNIDTLVNYLS